MSWEHRRRGASSSCSSSSGPPSPRATWRPRRPTSSRHGPQAIPVTPPARPWTPSTRMSRWPGAGSTTPDGWPRRPAAVPPLRDDPPARARRSEHAGAPAAAGRPAVECEALEVLGRLTQTVPEAAALFRRAADLAGRHGLTTWRLRALQELALVEARTPGEDRVLEVRRVAAHAGAHFTVAQMDLV